MSHVHSDLLVVLAGQPNTGKSTLFSLLTGLHQRIGNYPGVTVEKKSGHYHEGDRRIEVVDLPGTYSFSSYSQEERIARDFILLERPEVIVAVVDASNLRRHLHLLLQLLELQVPTVVCLNMVDMAERWGLKIDFKKLAESLDTPVVPMVGSKGKGLAELRAAILAVSEKTQTLNHEPTGWKIDYPAELGAILVPLEKALDGKEHLIEDFSSRWLAVKLLENDREARRIVQHHTHDDAWKPILEQADAARNSYETVHREPVSEAIVRSRNAKADATVATCITRIKPHARGTDVIDRFVCHPFFGLLLFALIMLVVFQIVFTLANDLPWFPQVGYAHETGWSCEWASPVDACGNFFEEWLPEYLNARLALPETGLFASFLYKGVLAGVGGVLTFVPLIFFMFLTLALLERSGYFARAVVVLDGLLRRFGLHGQSVLPLALAGGIVGGCAVPAIMATRSMKEQRERLLTILVIPLMNCGAKIPVYGPLIAAFFPSWQGCAMSALVLFSWTIALLCARVLGKTLVHGEASPLMIELPAYHWPDPKAVLHTAILQSWWFVKKAGTFILAVNILLWFLMSFPRVEGASDEIQMEQSFAGRIGKTLEPLGRLAGFDWKDNIALLGGFAAKEVIVSSLSTLHSDSDPGAAKNAEGNHARETAGKTLASHAPGDTAENPEPPAEEDADAARRLLADRLHTLDGWTPVKAVAMMIFVMVYAPCTATCAVILRETGQFRWVAVALAYTTTLAFVFAVLIYQIGSLLFYTGAG